jgi:L-seryl-tRNA(Ser) seleniumtransferase
MLTTPFAGLSQRAERFATRLRQSLPTATIEVCEDRAFVGGGSLPDVAVPTVIVAVSIPNLSEGELAARLRTGHPPVVSRVKEGKLLLDLRTVFERQEGDLLTALSQATTLENLRTTPQNSPPRQDAESSGDTHSSVLKK